LPDETCANDCWNSEDDADSCFSFRFHIFTPQLYSNVQIFTL
jgi:hypothetical protein